MSNANSSGKTLIHAQNIESKMFLIPSDDLVNIAHMFGVPPRERETLVKNMRSILGTLLWNVTDSRFIHPETNIHFELDQVGLRYRGGLSNQQEAELWAYPAATCVMECAQGNHLEFWMRRTKVSPRIYLITDYKNSTSHQTPAIREELARTLLVTKQEIMLKEMGTKKRVEPASGPGGVLDLEDL